MADKVVRATAAGLMIRAFAVRATETVEEARRRHGTSPVMTAALGRLLAAGAMMGTMMKGEDDLLTLTIRSDGPGQGLTVTSDSHGNVKGYALCPEADVPDSAPGKLNVGEVIGPGTLTVSMDLGLAEPYNGQIELVSGEIGEDLTYYFAKSEQTPSAVGLGVMVDKDCTVRHAGGFIIQLMPDATEGVISIVERNLKGIDHVTSFLEEGYEPEDILGTLLLGLDPEFTDEQEIRFRCNCSRERVAGALASIQTGDLREMIDECLKDERYASGRERARAEAWANIGCSASRIADYLEEKLRALADEKKDNSTGVKK